MHPVLLQYSFVVPFTEHNYSGFVLYKLCFIHSSFKVLLIPQNPMSYWLLLSW